MPVTLDSQESMQLLTAEALAKTLSVKLSWIRDYTGPSVPDKKRIPSVKIGERLTRYRLGDVLSWLSAHQDAWNANQQKSLKKRYTAEN